MRLGGLQKFTALDFPGRLAAIVFTQGCNFRCHFCYNPELVLPTAAESQPALTVADFFAWLEKRRGLLDGVVVTGGEPTIHQDLPEFIKQIKDLSFAVKLDTNGTNPEMLEQLLAAKLLDYLAMDLKAPANNYSQVVAAPVDFSKIQKSVKIIMDSGLDYEFRTTLVPGLHQLSDLETMAQIIKGAAVWHLQQFKSDAALVDPDWQGKAAFVESDLNAALKQLKNYVPNCQIRQQ